MLREESKCFKIRGEKCNIQEISYYKDFNVTSDHEIQRL